MHFQFLLVFFFENFIHSCKKKIVCQFDLSQSAWRVMCFSGVHVCSTVIAVNSHTNTHHYHCHLKACQKLAVTCTHTISIAFVTTETQFVHKFQCSQIRRQYILRL